MSRIVNHPARILVVSGPTTERDDLITSLRAASTGVFVTARIEGCVATVPAGTCLVVFLADCFRFDQVVGALFALRRERPEVHAVLATAAPERFSKLVAAAVPPPSIIGVPVSAGTISETVELAVRHYKLAAHSEPHLLS